MQPHRPTPPTLPCHVTLRDVQPTDLPALFAIESNLAWCAMAMIKPRSAAAFEAAWARVFQDRAAGVVQKVILADGEVCGSIGCRVQGGRCDVGYGLGPEYWGKGIASRALALLLAQVPLRPLHATAAASNAASIRVLMKHGFVITETRSSPETERFLAREEVSLVLA